MVSARAAQPDKASAIMTAARTMARRIWADDADCAETASCGRA
jgi:hypothetical protein